MQRFPSKLFQELDILPGK